MLNKKIIFWFGCLLLASAGCKKFVQVQPPITALATASVYNSNATAEAALSGVYITMEGNSVGGGANGISALLGLSADEFNLFPGSGIVLSQVYANAQTSVGAPGIWTDLYNVLYQANSIIGGANSSDVITSEKKQQLIGEAEFIRAFCLFYLVNIYGNIPLITTTNYDLNKTLSQSPAAKVYAQIVADLKDAQTRLGSDYLDASGNTSSERVRPNNGAANALLARTYLYMGIYDSAEQAATAVINNPAYSLYLTALGLDSIFQTSSTEAIWQLELPTSDFFNTPDGGVFLGGFLYVGGPATYAPYTLSDGLMSSFEPNDLRRVHWTDSLNTGSTIYYFPYKYKLFYTGQPPVEYPTILRLSEQYLIRAEARAEQGNTIDATSDLNTIRSRAGLPATTAATQSDLLNAIAHERRVELFTEYGHRWLDLKRSGSVDSVMTTITPLKGGNWQNTAQLYVIPLYDIQTDPNLKQNEGYN